MRKIKSVLFLSVLGFAACDKENAEISESSLLEFNTVVTEVVAEEAESVLDDIVMYSESAFGVDANNSSKTSTSKNSKDKKRGRSEFFKECADIVVEESDGIVTTTITFNEGCEDRYGNTISGKIVRVKVISEESKERTVTITDFTINGYVINGTKVYNYVSSNDNGNPEITGTIEMIIETEDGNKTKTGTRTIEITAGGDTDTCKDDEKTITGSSVYTNAQGLSSTVTITTPLVKPADCRYKVSGVKEYALEIGTVVLDFGDGTCDNVATKTGVDGTITEIRLGKKRRKKQS